MKPEIYINTTNDLFEALKINGTSENMTFLHWSAEKLLTSFFNSSRKIFFISLEF